MQPSPAEYSLIFRAVAYVGFSLFLAAGCFFFFSFSLLMNFICSFYGKTPALAGITTPGVAWHDHTDLASKAAASSVHLLGSPAGQFCAGLAALEGWRKQGDRGTIAVVRS